MIGEAVYMRATHPGSPFFVDSRSLMAHAEESWDPEPDCPIGWASNKSVVWTYMQPTACIMRTHGWKIHVTASLDNAQSVLEKVSKICISEHVMFKYLRDKQQYRSSNTKYAGRSSSGKFITIYPFSDEHLERLTLKLEEAIGGEPGPYILSDLRYNNGPIFFRYGAFVSIEMSDAEGEKISLIPDADGVLKEDIRGVRPIIPHGVPIPPVVNEAYEAYNKNLSTELDNYVDLKAVHFSNAGGVYSARNRDDEQVILKEARPYAGLDDNKQDATTRLAHEWSILKHAEHLGITPKPLKQFKVWEHHFVEMECITGTPFNDWITEHMPIVRDSYQAMQDYKQRSLQIAHLLIDTVEKLHTTGYAHGDLQLANVFVSENDDAVRLIDLEAARNLKDTNPPAMNAMGFQPPKHCTAEQADWFAVSRLIATLFDIQNNITILSPEYWSVFLKRIQEAFGEEPVSLINSLNERYPGENGIVVVPATPTESIRPYTWKLPQQQVSLHDIQLISNQTVKGIEATRHAVPGKLFPADAKLESNYAHVNIATGAAGVLLSLIRAGKTVDPADVRWTFDSLVNGISESADYGLFSGLTGMATFFYEVGKKDWAKNLIKQVSGNWKSLRNVNLEKGLSGIGLALTAFGASEEEDQYIGTAVNIADHIHQVLFDTDIEHEHKKLSHSSGLFQGWSGAALFFSSLGKVTEDPRYFSWASACIEHDLSYTDLSDSGRRGVIEGEYNRSLPYLTNGSAGLLTAISWARLMQNNESLFSDVFESLVEACASPTYAFSGLYNGRAGIMSALAVGKTWISDYAEIQTMHLKNLLDYSLAYHEQPVFVGDSMLRLSADYSTGSAGVLSALTSMTGSGWEFLPIVNPDQFCGQQLMAKQISEWKEV